MVFLAAALQFSINLVLMTPPDFISAAPRPLARDILYRVFKYSRTISQYIFSRSGLMRQKYYQQNGRKSEHIVRMQHQKLEDVYVSTSGRDLCVNIGQLLELRQGAALL
jgi:hypothetical protein